jgi:glutamate-1-semialdehyde 2,1-aminomutase
MIDDRSLLRQGMKQATSRSYELYERARRSLPGGTARESTFARPHPTYVRAGHGCRMVDVDGVERLDFNGNFTSMINGHAHPAIREAAIRQIELGTSFPFPCVPEIELAEQLCARVATIDRIRFMTSGTEAVMMAIKAARAHTGRPKIAKCEGAFHGGYDYAEVSLDPSPDAWGPADRPASVGNARGTPRGVLADVVMLPFNDTESAARILEAERESLAGILIDPLPNRVGLIPARPEFLRLLRDFATANGVVLIFDEVIGFRLGYHGAQPEFGVEADLTVLGKIIGGGFPVGAVGGRERFMAVFDPSAGNPPLPQSGTFAGNPVAMAAGVANLQLLEPATFQRLNALGARARDSLTDALRVVGVEGQVTGLGSLFRIHMTARPFTTFRSARPEPEECERLGRLYRYFFDHGILIASTGLGCISTPMTEADIDRLAEIAVDALRTIAAGPT